MRGSIYAVGYDGRSPLKHHAHVMQAGDETGAIGSAAAGCAVAEPDNIGAILAKPALGG